jgi:hypothetical protein
MSEFWIIKNKDNIQHLSSHLTECVQRNEPVTLEVRHGKTRSARQRSALEVWCRAIADSFNDAGITREIHSPIFKGGSFECDWSRDSVKNEIWRPVQVALTQKESTTEATTVEYTQVYETLVRAFGNKGITLPAWPVKED